MEVNKVCLKLRLRVWAAAAYGVQGEAGARTRGVLMRLIVLCPPLSPFPSLR